MINIKDKNITKFLNNLETTGYELDETDFTTKYIKVTSKKIKENIKSWSNSRKHFDVFTIYDGKEFELWKSLYEKIGTFNGVKMYLKNKHGVSKSDTTIKKVIKEKFEESGKNFDKWLKLYDKSGPKYLDEDLNIWKELYEEIGSFLGVSKYIIENFGKKIHDTSIKRSLERKFNKEGRNFKQWVAKYDKSSDRSGFKEIYSEDEIRNWIKLYQEIGSYKGVVKYLTEKFGKAPNDTTIKRKIQDYFILNNNNFSDWEEKFSNLPLGRTQGYPDEEVERWENLYENIGSFLGVSDYIKEVEGSAPADITIKRRLKYKFHKEKRNFKAWIHKYENWHFKQYSEADVKMWVKLYEKIGSFYGVERYLRDKYGNAPDNYTIFTRIKQKFDKENRNFEKWISVFGQNFFEEVCRSYFEIIFRVPFPKKSPKWLINPLTGYKMHLDGYDRKLGIAFEYNGPQHYGFIQTYHKTYQDLKEQQNRDIIKKSLCDKNKVHLIIIPYNVKISDMQDYIIDQFEQKTKLKLPAQPKYDYTQFFYNDNLDRFL